MNLFDQSSTGFFSCSDFNHDMIESKTEPTGSVNLAGSDSFQVAMETLPYAENCTDGNGNAGRWTSSEHQLFIDGFHKYGKDWRKLGTIITSRTVLQIRTHAQKYLLKLQRALRNPNKVLTPEQMELISKHSVSIYRFTCASILLLLGLDWK